jgi:hypothetical protein
LDTSPSKALQLACPFHICQNDPAQIIRKIKFLCSLHDLSPSFTHFTKLFQLPLEEEKVYISWLQAPGEGIMVFKFVLKKSFSTHPSPLHCQFLWLKLKPETFPLIPLPKGLSLEETHSKAIPAFDVAPVPPETI